MSKIEHILIASDGSELSTKAAAFREEDVADETTTQVTLQRSR